MTTQKGVRPGQAENFRVQDPPAAAAPRRRYETVIISLADLWDYLDREGLEVTYGRDGELWLRPKDDLWEGEISTNV